MIYRSRRPSLQRKMDAWMALFLVLLVLTAPSNSSPLIGKLTFVIICKASGVGARGRRQIRCRNCPSGVRLRPAAGQQRCQQTAIYNYGPGAGRSVRSGDRNGHGARDDRIRVDGWDGRNDDGRKDAEHRKRTLYLDISGGLYDGIGGHRPQWRRRTARKRRGADRWSRRRCLIGELGSRLPQAAYSNCPCYLQSNHEEEDLNTSSTNLDVHHRRADSEEGDSDHQVLYARLKHPVSRPSPSIPDQVSNLRIYFDISFFNI